LTEALDDVRNRRSRQHVERGLYRASLRSRSRRLALEQMRSSPNDRREWISQMNLLWAVAFVFVLLWMVGFLALHVTTGLIHVLLVLAVVAVVFRLVSSRRAA
jgi:Family of unknown function (DUF5670)